MRTCNRCKKEKDLSEFSQDVRGKNGYKRECKSCICERAKQWRDQNPEKHREQHRKWARENREKKRRTTKSSHLRKKFSISIDAYEAMFSAQNGCCAICKRHRSEFEYDLSVDHNHLTGKIRGLLCSNCNCGIGNLMEDRAIFLSALSYLDRTNV